jgi:hypothetical protein
LVTATLHKLAVDVELGAPECERWIVQTERGMVMLKNLAG